ncbi:MAG: exopolysaccharide biosynthesis polyprenyl glycosylphosphotransferase [Gaiellaceae bacterium]
MVTRPLTGVEALPALEPIELEAPQTRASTRLRALGALGSWTRGAFLLDVAMLTAAAVAAQLGARRAGILPVPDFWLALFAALTLLMLRLRGMYSWRVRLQTLDDVRSVLSATVLAAMVVVSVRILLPGNLHEIGPQTLRILAFSAVYLVAGRVALDWAQDKARRQGEAAKPTLIVGAGRIGRLAAQRLLDHPEFGLRPVGFLDKEPLDEPGLPIPVVGASWDLERLVEQHGIEHLVMTFSTAPSEVLLREIKRCEQLGVGVSTVPRLFESMSERLEVEHIGGLPLVTARKPNPKGWQFEVKHGIDRLVALFALLLTLPVLAAGALAVWVSMGRPIFFRQRRDGRDGRPVEVWKLRTMKLASPDTLPQDDESDRRTAVGDLIRRSSIDELPQLFNVLRGDMSLIGPRPTPFGLVRAFEENVHRYDDRHRVKAGITGWAQVHGIGRGGERYSESLLTERTEWDNYYIENWSPWLDVKIVFMTVMAVLRSFRNGD